jgi:uncharacterized protein
MREGGEQSIEDILRSIKQVMDRGPRGPGNDGPVQYGDDVLELSESAAIPAQDQSSPFQSAPYPQHEPSPPGFAQSYQPSDPGLIGDQAFQSVRSSLESLTSYSGQGAGSGGGGPDSSFELLMREMLRPALAEWLDRNLPPMVERLVREEIGRIMNRRG